MEERKQAMEDMRNDILVQILSQDARARCQLTPDKASVD